MARAPRAPRKRWDYSGIYTDDPQLFSHKVKLSVTTDAAEHRNPFLGAEATRNLLLDFHHPKVSLSLVVVKGNSKIVQETGR
jgi:hypothetical protein